MQPQDQKNNQPPYPAQTPSQPQPYEGNVPPPPSTPIPNPQPQQSPAPVVPQPNGFDPSKVYDSGPNAQSFGAATTKNNARALVLILSAIPLFIIGWFFTIFAMSIGGAAAYKGGLEAKAFGNKKLFILGMVVGTVNLLFVVYYFIVRATGKN
jgi:hypothetical protein